MAVPGATLFLQAVGDLDVSAEEFFAPLGLPPATRDFIYAAIAYFAGVDPADGAFVLLQPPMSAAAPAVQQTSSVQTQVPAVTPAPPAKPEP